MTKRPGLAAVFLLVATFGAFSTPAVSYQAEVQPVSPETIQSFERFVVERMAFDQIPGLSVGFVKGDFTWARGFGWADVENKSPAKAESSYRLASISKTITAVAVLKLVEEGKIKLDAQIQAYVPYFPRKRWPVTVRQLLGHVGGISHYRNDAVEGHIKESKNTREALAIFQDFPLVAEPGTKYNYSSYGYNLLGAAIEGASGLPYGRFVKTYIFDPLGMADSRMDSPREIIPNRVRGYQLVNGVLRNSEYVDISSRFAAGGLRSTVVDLLKYARGIMRGEILSQETWRTMFAPLVLRNGLMTGYGLGWGVEPWNGHFAVNHSGSQPETRTQLLVFPGEDFAVAIACNLEGTNLLPYVQRLADLVLDEESGLSAYTPGSVQQAIYQAVDKTFDYGLSAYLWTGGPLSNDPAEIKRAFEYFFEATAENKLSQDFDKAKKQILAGIHPSSHQALTAVGSYMAWALEGEMGPGSVRSYHGRGPIAFFNDYIRLSSEAAFSKRFFRFNGELSRLLATWENDWAKTHTDEFRRLVITPATDFEALIPRLKEAFAGASICPDLSPNLVEAAEYCLRSNDSERAGSVLSLGREVYPASPLLATALGYVMAWSGRTEEAQNLYREAHNLDPTHPVLRVDQFIASMRRLVQAHKRKEAEDLGLIAVQIHPREPALFTALGDLNMLNGKREAAVGYYRKALWIDPNFEEARRRLKSLGK